MSCVFNSCVFTYWAVLKRLDMNVFRFSCVGIFPSFRLCLVINGGRNAPTDSWSSYHHHVPSIHPSWHTLPADRVWKLMPMQKQKKTFPTMTHPICFGETSAKLWRLNGQEISFWIKTFNASSSLSINWKWETKKILIVSWCVFLQVVDFM